MNNTAYKLRKILEFVERVMKRYDPERDLIPNTPSVTHSDMTALQAVSELTKIVMGLVSVVEGLQERALADDSGSYDGLIPDEEQKC